MAKQVVTMQLDFLFLFFLKKKRKKRRRRKDNAGKRARVTKFIRQISKQ
jgi:hypothetical protein